MAMIECIECGNSISSLAVSCPHCGCPSEYQQNNLNNTSKGQECVEQGLKNRSEWDAVKNYLIRRELRAANKMTQNLTGEPLTKEIIMETVKTGELPIEMIIDTYPDQAINPIKKIQPTTRPCKACNKTISVKAEKCPHCGEPTGVRVCPRCGSTDVVILDAVSKAVSMALFGVFSVNTVRSKYECWTCHFKF